MNCKRLIISGRVQGVGFRPWMVEKARALGVSGWVRNRIDGSVEALVAGDTAAVEELLRLCRRGPRMAEVVSIEEDLADPPDVVWVPAGSVLVGGVLSGGVACAPPSPNTSCQAARRAASASAMVTGRPSAWRLVTPCSLMPHGTMPA